MLAELWKRAATLVPPVLAALWGILGLGCASTKPPTATPPRDPGRTVGKHRPLPRAFRKRPSLKGMCAQTTLQVLANVKHPPPHLLERHYERLSSPAVRRRLATPGGTRRAPHYVVRPIWNQLALELVVDGATRSEARNHCTALLRAALAPAGASASAIARASLIAEQRLRLERRVRLDKKGLAALRPPRNLADWVIRRRHQRSLRSHRHLLNETLRKEMGMLTRLAQSIPTYRILRPCALLSCPN